MSERLEDELWYQHAKERCDQDPEKPYTMIMDQGEMTDEQFKEQILTIEGYAMAGMLPKNLHIAFFGLDANDDFVKMRRTPEPVEEYETVPHTTELPQEVLDRMKPIKFEISDEVKQQIDEMLRERREKEASGQVKGPQKQLQ